MADEIYDLVVIGGGINGCGIAADGAARGLRVLLAEADDLAGATSSASSKLIHGGLRYLEHYEFRLVREALAEREVLLRIAPAPRPAAQVHFAPHRRHAAALDDARGAFPLRPSGGARDLGRGRARSTFAAMRRARLWSAASPEAFAIGIAPSTTRGSSSSTPSRRARRERGSRRGRRLSDSKRRTAFGA